METYFLFLDESYSPPLREDKIRITSLTGIVLSVEQIIKVRDTFLEIVSPLFISNKKMLTFIPEIHGSNMLPGKEDNVKIDMFNSIAKLPSRFDFPIYRLGYFIDPYFKNFKGDEQGISLCWRGLLSTIQVDYGNNYLLPVMDMVKQKDIRKFSGMIHSLHSYRTAGYGKSLSISKSENLLGEVFFADSRYSIMTQIVDVISYLRNLNDLKCEGHAFSEFKEGVNKCNEYLIDNLILDEIIEMNKMIFNRKNNKTHIIIPPTPSNQ